MLWDPVRHKVFEANSDDNSFGEEELLARFSGRPIPEFYKAPLDESATADEEDEDEAPLQAHADQLSTVEHVLDERNSASQPQVQSQNHPPAQPPTPKETPAITQTEPQPVNAVPTAQVLPRAVAHNKPAVVPKTDVSKQEATAPETQRSSRLQGAPQPYYGDTHRSARQLVEGASRQQRSERKFPC